MTGVVLLQGNDDEAWSPATIFVVSDHLHHLLVRNMFRRNPTPGIIVSDPISPLPSVSRRCQTTCTTSRAQCVPARPTAGAVASASGRHHLQRAGKLCSLVSENPAGVLVKLIVVADPCGGRCSSLEHDCWELFAPDCGHSIAPPLMSTASDLISTSHTILIARFELRGAGKEVDKFAQCVNALHGT